MWNILVVDDEPDNRALLVALLEDCASCDCAASGAEAVKAFEASTSGQTHLK